MKERKNVNSLAIITQGFPKRNSAVSVQPFGQLIADI